MTTVAFFSVKSAAVGVIKGPLADICIVVTVAAFGSKFVELRPNAILFVDDELDSFA